MLRELDVRRAIVHSIDCQGIVDSIYAGATSCRGNHGAPSVLGITEENIKPYEYDPALSRQLLEDIGYICGLPNSREDCEAEISITSRTDRIAKNQELVESMASLYPCLTCLPSTVSTPSCEGLKSRGLTSIPLPGCGGSRSSPEIPAFLI